MEKRLRTGLEKKAIEHNETEIILLDEICRKKLGLEEKSNLYKTYSFEISKSGNFIFHLFHPNPVVRYTTRVTIVAIILGVISVILSIKLLD